MKKQVKQFTVKYSLSDRGQTISIKRGKVYRTYTYSQERVQRMIIRTPDFILIRNGQETMHCKV